MANLPSLANRSLSSKAQEDEKSAPPAPSHEVYCNDFISTLPLEQGWVPFRNRYYHGFWIPEIYLPGLLALGRDFNPRPPDIFLASCPKSGTTWCKALIFATVTRDQYSPSAAGHPLLSRNPHECVPNMDELFSLRRAPEVEAMPSPRMLSTHMPLSLLPSSITTTADAACRIVYVARDSKDALVSFWHFSNTARVGEKRAEEPFPLSKAGELFCQGRPPFGPVWEHVLEYWRESLRRPEKVLFFKYEEMLKDPGRSVRRLAEFLGRPFSPEEEEEGVVEQVVRLCSFETLKSLEVNKNGHKDTVYKVPYAAFFRKGEAGDWRNHLSPEMAPRMDGIMEEKLRGSGLALGSATSDRNPSSRS